MTEEHDEAHYRSDESPARVNVNKWQMVGESFGVDLRATSYKHDSDAKFPMRCCMQIPDHRQRKHQAYDIRNDIGKGHPAIECQHIDAFPSLYCLVPLESYRRALKCGSDPRCNKGCRNDEHCEVCDPSLDATCKEAEVEPENREFWQGYRKCPKPHTGVYSFGPNFKLVWIVYFDSSKMVTDTGGFDENCMVSVSSISQASSLFTSLS